jgi:uncharacterized membrane protein (UPF0182 family)
MTDPKTFYKQGSSLGDSLTCAIDTYGIVLFNYENSRKRKKEEYFLFMPYTPAKGTIWQRGLQQRCDDPDYGKLIVYTFPRGQACLWSQTGGCPVFDQDRTYSQQVNPLGTKRFSGHTRKPPHYSHRNVAYVHSTSLSCAEDKGGLPELRRVIVAYENNVVMEDNLELCLQRLFGGRRSAPVGGPPDTQQKTSIDGLPKKTCQLFEKQRKLQRQGDWAG